MQVADLSPAARPVRRAERFFANGRVRPEPAEQVYLRWPGH